VAEGILEIVLAVVRLSVYLGDGRLPFFSDLRARLHAAAIQGFS
jgi:hypothetical protein